MRSWGLARVEITGADLPGSLKALGRRGVILTDIRPGGPLSILVTLNRGQLKLLESICKKRGDNLKIIRKMGISWQITAFLRRPILVLGLALILGLTLFLPTRILFIGVEGNRAVPVNRILEAAEQCGVRFWASRRELRSEQVKNALLEAIPELQWAGVNTRGCTATISVREGTPAPREPEPAGISSLTAVTDGVVDSCTATEGTLLVRPGQAVEKGQLLISGYTDCGRILRAGQAKGSVFARTRRTFSAVTPDFSLIKAGEEREKRIFRLIVGKNRIKFGKDSGIWDPSCGRMYEEYYITLPGGFQLPIGLAVDRYIFRQTRRFPLPDHQAEQALLEFSRTQLRDQMIAGQILAPRQSVTRGNGVFRLEGTYLCHEMIGRVRQEQIGE